ncbi:HAD-IIIC family phosphatase [Bradyrhizobium sp. 200]|uniref:HAD-IIIC family phosphatase n=1 Tax=Bradyrhizobium sp. 200 TaxID=2782665 RepID=UPI001FFEFE73|nr:HAD-IIIC family phosphatase [Bradyrhizobium sp. 200]UPJ51910.1 HAD-IIIC family phosphatase [Bradyrhizobium sp. 200]
MPVAPAQADRIATFQQSLRISKLREMNSRELLTLASRFERIEPEFVRAFGDRRKSLKLSILASLSAQHLCSSLKLFLYAEGLAPVIHLGGYDAVTSGTMQPNADIWKFAPDVTLLVPSTEDIKTWPRMFAPAAEVEEWARRQSEIYLAIWDVIAEKLPGCRVYHALFVQPLERPLGNLERRYPFSRSNCLRALNDRLVAQRPKHVHLVDLDALADLVGRQHWFDETGYFLTKQPISLRELPLVGAYLARLIASGRGDVKKCLVLDLDNTLWGGVVGDDGVDGIRIDPSDPVGEAYVHFQKYLLALKERGVLLAVCSKNDDAIARSAFVAKPEMPLKLSDFSAFQANWDDKVTNIRRIADGLNIGVDSLVFFDDNPAEREIVNEYEPLVLTINVPPDPAHYIRALDLSFAFEWEQLTEEDIGRSETYARDRERQQLESQFTDYDDYLRSLQMKAWIEPVSNEGSVRIVQLFGKTNQFNTRTRRYSESAIARLGDAPDSCVIQVKFADRFSNYGIVASAVLNLRGNAVFIDNWVMSCRVFERGLENAMFEAMICYARENSAERIVGEFIPTAKNVYVKELFERLGFDPLVADGDFRPEPDGTLYSLPLSRPPATRHYIDTIMTLDGAEQAIKLDLSQHSEKKVRLS